MSHSNSLLYTCIHKNDMAMVFDQMSRSNSILFKFYSLSVYIHKNDMAMVNLMLKSKITKTTLNHYINYAE